MTDQISRSGDRTVRALRWTARALSLAIVLFWGAFLIEHLSWFASTPKPPPWVWLLQGLHLLMLVGYLLAFKWERTGSAIAAASAIVFFSAAAGPNAPLFILAGMIPLALYAYTWVRVRHA